MIDKKVGRPLNQAATRAEARDRGIHRTAVSSVVTRIISIGLGLISIPLLLGHLGKEQYGLWMLLSSVVAWMQLVDFGVGGGLSNALAEANGRGTHAEAATYINTALLAMLLIMVCSGLLVVALVGHIPWSLLFGANFSAPEQLAELSFLAIVFVFLLTLPSSLAISVFNAYQKGYVPQRLQIFSGLISLGATYLGIHLEWRLPTLIIAVSTGPFVICLILWSQVGRVIPDFRLSLRHVRLSAFKRISHSSVPLFFFQLGALAVNQLVNVVLIQVSSLRVVADYNVVLKVYLAIFSIGAGLAFPYYSAIREAYERADLQWVIPAVKRLLLVRILTVMLLSLPLIVAGDWVIGMLMREPLDRAFGFTGWSFVFLSMVLASASSSASEILTGLDKIWFQIPLVVISALVVLGTIPIFVKEMGAAGVFLSMAISTIAPMAMCYQELIRRVRHE